MLSIDRISIIIALISVFISALALIVSIRNAKIPYKKSLWLYLQGHYRDNDNLDSFDIIAVNSGNREVFIEYLGLVEGTGNHPKELLEYFISREDESGIKPGEKFKKGYGAPFYYELFSKISNLNNVYICAKDSEGKRYFNKIKLEKEPKL